VAQIAVYVCVRVQNLSVWQPPLAASALLTGYPTPELASPVTVVWREVNKVSGSRYEKNGVFRPTHKHRHDFGYGEGGSKSILCGLERPGRS